MRLFSQGGFSLADLMLKGRWDNPKTLSHYLQEGFATSKPQEAERIRALAKLLPDVVFELASADDAFEHELLRATPLLGDDAEDAEQNDYQTWMNL